MREKVKKKKKKSRGHTDLNHGPIGLQPIALPLSYIPTVRGESKAGSYCKSVLVQSPLVVKISNTIKAISCK